MEKLLDIDIARRGLWKVYFGINNEKKLDKLAFVWYDRDRSYFISNTSSLKPGMSNSMDRLIQVDYSPNADPVRFEFEINQLRVDEIYYSRNLEIDESNCTRQDDLQFYFIFPKIIYYAYTGLLLVLLKEVQVYPVPP